MLQQKDGQVGRGPWFPDKSKVIVTNHEDKIKLVLFLSSIRNTFPNEAEHCGIYEWQARFDGQPNRVLYVGSTCRGKAGALRDRILEYCRNGSHKKDLINDALRRGYELWVRVKISQARHNCRKDAERMENELLAEYNYAWNIRNNAVRSILP